MARVLAAFVHVWGEEGRQVALAPGTEVPAWAVSQVTNPKAYADGSPEAVKATDDAPVHRPLPDRLRHAELKAVAKARGLSAAGSASVLTRRIEADDREKAAAASAAATKTAADIAATTSAEQE